MPGTRFQYLFNNYLSGSISDAEAIELMNFCKGQEHDKELQGLLDEMIKNTDAEYNMPKEQAGAILQAIFKSDEKVSASVHRVHFLRTAWFRYAAAVLILFGIVLPLESKIVFSGAATKTLSIQTRVMMWPPVAARLF